MFSLRTWFAHKNCHPLQNSRSNYKGLLLVLVFTVLFRMPQAWLCYGVEEFMVEKSGVEKIRGWKLWGWNFLQPYDTCPIFWGIIDENIDISSPMWIDIFPTIINFFGDIQFEDKIFDIFALKIKKSLLNW